MSCSFPRSAQPTHPRRCRLTGGVGARVEGGCDLLVGQVVAVAEHDRRALLGWQPVGEIAEISRYAGLAVRVRTLRRLGRELLAAACDEACR